VATSHPELRVWVAEQAERLAPTSLLDVGPGEGTYGRLLAGIPHREAVEVWEPYVAEHRLADVYQTVHIADIRTWRWPDRRWDLIVCGDVLEHMTRDEAAHVYAQAQKHADAVLVCLPIVDWPQHGHDNPYETHVVPDWRHEQAVEAFTPSAWTVGEVTGAYLWTAP
jgi:hypothetical protein